MPRLPKFDLNEVLARAGRLKDAVAGLKDAAPALNLGEAKNFLRGLGEQLEGGLDTLVPNRPPPPVASGARYETRVHTGPAGQRSCKLYIPSKYAGQPVPLLVMLHGCGQSPDDFALGTRMNELAEEQVFVVAYPEQARSANVSKCWNWFREDDQKRGQGEPSLIAGIAREIMGNLRIDPARVYVAGLSAGGSAAAVLGATYPDLFKGVGVHSGLACGAARDLPTALIAMKTGAPSPRRFGGVPTIVFHGDDDKTVHPANGDAVIAQAKTGDAGPRVDGGLCGGLRYTRLVYADDSGLPMQEHWILHGAGHAWSGGNESGSFTDPRGPDASREMMRFFRQR